MYLNCLCLCKAKDAVEQQQKKLSRILHLFELVWDEIWCYNIKDSVFLVLFM